MSTGSASSSTTGAGATATGTSTTSGTGHQTFTPISSSIARWRASSRRVCTAAFIATLPRHCLFR
ncbi:hypothetical protein [Variovorax paradoxus]|uniref:hypothetical protein n=1 Tax=Variovorax paradoxus TaxID=34073 RepID=UPI00247A0B1D